MSEKEDFFFMVYVEGEHTPAYKHSDLTSAETEAKRLAESLNRKAYVLCSIKSFEVNKFIENLWKRRIKRDKCLRNACQ